MSKELIQKLNQNKIQDGLLRDFISRGLYVAALGEISSALDKREDEVVFLRILADELEDIIAKEGVAS